MITRCIIPCLWLACAGHAADTRLVRETGPLSPEEERQKLTVPEGFTVQLFASEPMINKPINMAFDARGRLWVSSTVEYPYSADKSRWSDEKGTRVKDSRDAIKILEDTDGDGRADKVTDFADGLNIPTGVLPWHKPEHKAGCIAWSIPNIWYFADTDGDGKADLREVLFGPLGYEKDTHGMCSSFRLGLDGWIYATHGFNNTSTFRVRGQAGTSADFTDSADGVSAKSVSSADLELHSGNVFRFRPDGSAVEEWTRGQVNPFGLAWDRYGNLYSADCHSSPVYQLIRGAHYPSFGKPHDGLGFAPVMCQHTHGSTGICGIVYLDGGVWGPEWDDHVFLGNVVTSRVNLDKVTFTGSTPKANERPDFVTSADPWFRPVDLQLGPDNALYIADFYNRIIGHYEVPLDHPGRDRERGRIWRVVRKDIKAVATDFTRMSPREIAEEMGSPNLIRRHLALQEVRRRGDKSWLTDFGRVFADDSPFPPFTPAGDAWPEGYADSEPHDFKPLPLEWRKTDLRFAYTLWALSYLGERFAVASVLRHLHTGGWWVEDRDDELGGLLMAHATQIVGAQEKLHPWERWALGLIFDFRGSAAGRAAVQVLQNRPDFFLQVPDREPDQIDEWRFWTFVCLIELCDRMIERPADDLHLQGDTHYVHALKVLLRDWLAQPWFRHDNPLMTELKPTTDKPWFLSVLQSVPTAEAAAFLLDSLMLESPPERWKHVARHHRPETLSAAVAFARLPGGQPLERLQALADGLSERGMSPPAELLAWARELAEEHLANAEAHPEASWLPVPQTEPAPVWSLRTRPCADGVEARVLQSMGQGGGAEESRTGALKSRAFAAPEKLALWINGHRGPPTAGAHEKNLVRVVESATGTTLAHAFPPRNDTAQRTELDLSSHVGKTVHLELVDGDAGKAYAWLGITRIEPPVVRVENFEAESQRRETLQKLAILLQHSAPAALRERLAAHLPPRPAPPPLPVSPELRRQLDALIAARSTAYAKAAPDKARGAQIFQTHCAACHQTGGQGGIIGPQLDGIGTRGVERLCEDILDPNRNVDAHFHLHILTLQDGSTLSGFLKAEAGQVLILADAAGREQRVSKSTVVKDDAQPLSLMPPVFGQTIPEKDFTDLLGWLLEK
ncbi:MAG TPA: c-type cytochrome [Prosthecobacter sp.]|nr:c-type cytochrome [Prosthecobacter sp.]